MRCWKAYKICYKTHTLRQNPASCGLGSARAPSVGGEAQPELSLVQFSNHIWYLLRTIFTARPHCSQVAMQTAVPARGILYVCLSVTFR